MLVCVSYPSLLLLQYSVVLGVVMSLMTKECNSLLFSLIAFFFIIRIPSGFVSGMSRVFVVQLLHHHTLGVACIFFSENNVI